MHDEHEHDLVDQGIRLKQAGDVAGALECYERAIASGHDVARAWYSKGVVHMERGEDSEAIECFEQATITRPEYVRAWVNLSVLHLRTGDPERALAHARQALAHAGDDPFALINQVLALQALRRTGEALAAIRAALDRMPENAEAWALRGDLETASGDRSAQRSYDRALSLDGENVRALTGKGFLADAFGRPAEALPYLDRALALAPEHHQAIKTKGCALLHLGRAEEALPVLEHAMAIAPDYPERFENAYNLACCHAKLGAHAEALSYLQSAIAGAPFDLRPHVRADADLAELRDLPEFERVLISGSR